MKRIEAKQQLVALIAAMAVTFSIVWALSGYAYSRPSSDASLTAKHVVVLRACS